MTAPDRNGRALTGWRYAMVAAVGGIGSGILAFAADRIEIDLPREVLIALTGSGFAWGLIAFLVALAGQRRRSATLGSVGVLLVGVGVYYLLVMSTGVRWQSNAVPEQGSNRGADVLLAAAFWALGSLFAGPLLAWLADRIRNGRPAVQSVVVGVVFGLLSSNGWHLIAFKNVFGRQDSLAGPLLASALVMIGLSACLALWLLAHYGRWRYVVHVLASAAVSAGLGLVLWEFVDRGRVWLEI